VKPASGVRLFHAQVDVDLPKLQRMGAALMRGAAFN
jgi:hypothetical protein